jgi:hypothetical protein
MGDYILSVSDTGSGIDPRFFLKYLIHFSRQKKLAKAQVLVYQYVMA